MTGCGCDIPCVAAETLAKQLAAAETANEASRLEVQELNARDREHCLEIGRLQALIGDAAAEPAESDEPPEALDHRADQEGRQASAPADRARCL
jgi:hypothetical protein